MRRSHRGAARFMLGPSLVWVAQREPDATLAVTLPPERRHALNWATVDNITKLIHDMPACALLTQAEVFRPM